MKKQKEYKLMVTIGLTEFCAIEYISANLEQLEKFLKERFDTLLGDISSFNEEHISIIIKKKRLCSGIILNSYRRKFAVLSYL